MSRRQPSYKKRFGQHHLVDGRLCRPLVDFLRPAKQQVIEIGPGGGVLTNELLTAEARVLALEVDISWAIFLRQRTRSPGLQVVVQDALEFSWQHCKGPVLVTGNLPFNVATPLIGRLLLQAATAPENFPRLGFMVQKEVADRLVAKPGDSAYGALSVWVAATASSRWLGIVNPGSFRPPPKVAAAFVGFEPRQPAVPAEDLVSFRQVVHAAFQQRRKTVRNSLAATWGRERSEAALAAADIDPGCRAETLSVKDFVRLFRSSGQSGPK